VDTRIVAATNVDLKEAVSKRMFREDLYYRLCGFKLTQLPLNQRKKDIIPLALLFIQKNSQMPFPRLMNCAKKTLESYSWPGNVRELENLICRSLILCDGKEIFESDIMFDDEVVSATEDPKLESVTLANQGDHFQNPSDSVPCSDNQLGNVLMSNLRNELELQNIIAALSIAPTRSAAAEKLGISPRTLRYKINKLRDLGLPVPAAYSRV
jgi:two-component system response regulator FlrC